MSKKDMEELEHIVKPVLEYMKKNAGPYTEIVISRETISVKETTIGIPIKNGD